LITNQREKVCNEATTKCFNFLACVSISGKHDTHVSQSVCLGLTASFIKFIIFAAVCDTRLRRARKSDNYYILNVHRLQDCTLSFRG